MNDRTLEVIRQRELDLQAGLLAARQQAEAEIQEAARQSEGIRRESEAQLASELARLREQIATETAREVEAVRLASSRQAQLLAAATDLVPLLADHIVDAVARPTGTAEAHDPLLAYARG